jgi:hypothetical protein
MSRTVALVSALALLGACTAELPGAGDPTPGGGSGANFNESCRTSFYDAQWQVGFDPPADFVEADCDESPTCITKWEKADGTVRIELHGTDPHPDGFEEAVNEWVEDIVPAATGMELVSKEEVSLGQDKRGYHIEWFLDSGIDPLLNLHVLEAWVPSPAGQVQFTSAYLQATADVREALLRSRASMCVD